MPYNVETPSNRTVTINGGFMAKKILTITKGQKEFTLVGTELKGMLLVAGQTDGKEKLYAALAVSYLEGLCELTKLQMSPNGVVNLGMPNDDRIYLNHQDFDLIHEFIKNL